MKKHYSNKKEKNNAQNVKQNQDFPNIPQTIKVKGVAKINKSQIRKA